MKKLVVSLGEPAGIGPDIVLKALSKPVDADLTLVCSEKMFMERAALLGIKPHLEAISIIDTPTLETVLPGQLNQANSAYVLQCLEVACNLCLQKKADALVTAPIHKGVICDAGFNFTGHTEFLRDRAGVDEVVMMLASRALRVALVTTHLPLAHVPEAITPSLLERVLGILHHSLQTQFGIDEPRIGVCGLNPHAGENGHMGREEIEVITPVLEKLDHMKLMGPLPADTIFAKHHREQFDAILAMYHDQGLAPLKALSFSESVNITLGLPFLRTSVDHGTALDIAGSGKASESSFLEAITMAQI